MNAMLSPLPPLSPAAPWLAPLAGWSDLPFRLLCREYGAAVCCTEMVSAKGLVYESESGGRATHDLLATNEADAPLVVQVFGDDPLFVERAVSLLAERGYRYFDCNMGCSVPKVTKAGAGAALLKNPERALSVGRAMLRAAEPFGARVGFKLRLGWETGAVVCFDLGQRLEDAGASWLTLHPRSAGQGFSGLADREILAEFVRRIHVPVIASGDLWTAEDGLACVRETGVSTVMYARGALRDPAVFARYLRLAAPGLGPGVSVRAEDEPMTELRDRMLRHAALARTYSSPHTALLKMRTAIPRYIRHVEGASRLRKTIIGCRDWDAFEHALHGYFSAIAGGESDVHSASEA